VKNLKLVILLIFAFLIRLNAQNTVHLCVGEYHNFGVPNTLGSIYNWEVQNTTIATITSGNGTEQIRVDLNNAGLFQLIVEEVNVNGCSGYDSILVEVHDLPDPNIFAQGPISFCDGDSVLLQVDSVYSTSLWSNNESSSYIYADSTSNYFVTVTDINGCSNSSNSISVNSYAKPIASFVIDGGCLGDPTYFVDQSTTPLGQTSSGIWYLGNGDINYGDTISYIYNNIGDYQVSLSIQTNFGCEDSLTQLLSVFGNPEASFTYNPFKASTLNPEISFTNTSVDAIPSLWLFGDSTFSLESDPLHTYDAPGIYDVMLIVEDVNECTDSVTKKIIMYYDFVLYVPQAFTPNNDGDNDTFGPNGLRMEKYKSYNFQIYNKWGEIIFQTNDINEKWDGANAPTEVYSWLLVITDELGEVRKRNGLVTLIR